MSKKELWTKLNPKIKGLVVAGVGAFVVGFMAGQPVEYDVHSYTITIEQGDTVWSRAEEYYLQDDRAKHRMTFEAYMYEVKKANIDKNIGNVHAGDKIVMPVAKEL